MTCHWAADCKIYGVDNHLLPECAFHIKNYPDKWLTCKAFINWCYAATEYMNNGLLSSVVEMLWGDV